MTETAEEQTEPQGLLNRWEFFDLPPTMDQVEALLKTRPNIYGLKIVDYIDFVVAMPQNKKITGLRGPGGAKPATTYRDTWSLYFSVAGRIEMLNRAAAVLDWEVDHQPEMHTPEGCPPGYLRFDNRIVYREYLKITRHWDLKGDEPARFRLLGSKPGTAWVPAADGKGAAGSNPFEKVETSARGRAIAAWGIGVLPGSGVASLEEMLQAPDNQAHMDREQQGGQRGGSKVNRDEMLETVKTLSEEARQAMAFGEAAWTEKVGEYLSGIGVQVPTDPDGEKVLWNNAKDGQLLLTANKFRELIQQNRADQPI